MALALSTKVLNLVAIIEVLIFLLKKYVVSDLYNWIFLVLNGVLRVSI